MSLEDRSAKPAFDAASRAQTKEPGRGSSMVEKDRPHPAPRPSPSLAGDVDRGAFNATWNREGRAASEDSAARKEAFKAMRREAAEPARSFNRANTR